MKSIAAGLRCPYCRGRFLGLDVVVSCSGCGSRHHVGCWRQNGGCTVYGCNGEIRESGTLRMMLLCPVIAIVGLLNFYTAVALSFVIVPAFIGCLFNSFYLAVSLARPVERLSTQETIRRVCLLLLNLAPVIALYGMYFARIHG